MEQATQGRYQPRELSLVVTVAIGGVRELPMRNWLATAFGNRNLCRRSIGLVLRRKTSI